MRNNQSRKFLVCTIDRPTRILKFRRDALLEIRPAILILVILLTPAAGWSQTQLASDSNPPEYVQQSDTSQSAPAPAPPADKATATMPGQAPNAQNKKD